MKKIATLIIIELAAMLMFAMPTSAANEKEARSARIELYSFSDIHINKLSKTLGLSDDQKTIVIDVMDYFAKQMQCVAAEDNAATRSEMLKNTLADNNRYMRNVLTASQLKEYKKLLTATLYNRGILAADLK